MLRRLVHAPFADLCALFWSRRCLACGDACHAPVCAVCAADVVPRQGSACCVCDLDFVADGPAHRCRDCLRRPPPFDRAWGLFDYDSVAGEVVKAGKYSRQPGCLSWVARQVAANLPQALLEAPPAAVVPVPLHRRRVDRRGCAPPLILAAAVAHRLRVPLRRRVLRRKRDTPEQAGLDAPARRRNLRGAFAAGPSPTDVLLVDDVMTTGSTFAAAATALRQAGAARVRALAALRVA